MSDHSAPVADTVDEFCLRLKIGRTTAYKLIKAGRLKVVKLGRRTLVPRIESERLISDLMKEAT